MTKGIVHANFNEFKYTNLQTISNCAVCNTCRLLYNFNGWLIQERLIRHLYKLKV